MKVKRHKPNVKIPQYAYEVVSIDSGLDGGWASWDASSWNSLVPPLQTGIVKPASKAGEWQARLDDAMDQWRTLLDAHTWGHALIEWPRFFESEGGEKVARSEGLVKLAVAVGRLMEIFAVLELPVELVDVPVWKGQLPKPVVNARIEKKLGEEACEGFSSHAWDAVGIGLWGKGFF